MEYTLNEKEFQKVVKYFASLEDDRTRLNNLCNHYDEYNRKLIRDNKDKSSKISTMEEEIIKLKKQIGVLKSNESAYLNKINDLKFKLNHKEIVNSKNIIFTEEVKKERKEVSNSVIHKIKKKVKEGWETYA